jgi:hypothetical protein
MLKTENDQFIVNPWDSHNQQLVSHVHPKGLEKP